MLTLRCSDAGLIALGLSLLSAACFASTPTFAEGKLYVCAEHADPDDWDAEFAKGSVLVPAGTVFAFGGHIIGGSLLDPQDSAHYDTKGWKGVSAEENDRRSKLVSEDLSIDEKHSSAVATTTPVTLSKASPCAFAQAETVVSKEWGWVTPSIAGDPVIYYQAFGILRRGALDTNFSDDSVPLNFLAARGEMNALVQGAISKTLDLELMSASLPPDNQPVEGKGNSECFGDDGRQDITCRALTDDLLMSLRGATRAEVVKAMNVSGREIERGLHFLSNYSRGERWGSGDANFLFDDRGRVTVIFASLDPPNSEGKHADFIWNAEELPGGCSDVPGTRLKHCN